MRKCLALLIALLCLPVGASAQSLPVSFPGVQDYSRGSNGATWTLACDQSAVVNVSTATTTQIVAAVANKSIYVCSFALTSAGTTPSFQFEYGTGGTCGTGTTLLSGAFAPTSGSYTYAGGNLGLMFSAPVTNGLCIVSGGTTPSIQGLITYATF
jgi:hypothetical protein